MRLTAQWFLMTSPTPESLELRELADRAYELASRVEMEHQGNGFFQREYEIGEISCVISGYYDHTERRFVEEDLTIDAGCMVADEVIEVVIQFPGYTGEEPVNVKANGAAIPEILKILRQHMVLDDLSEV